MLWTSRVRRLHPSHLDPMPEGFVPTSYIEASKATTQSYFNTLWTLFRWQRCLRLLKSCEQRKEARCRNEAELESELQDIFVSSSFFLQLDWGMQFTLLWRLWRINDKCWNIQVQSKKNMKHCLCSEIHDTPNMTLCITDGSEEMLKPSRLYVAQLLLLHEGHSQSWSMVTQPRRNIDALWT